MSDARKIQMKDGRTVEFGEKQRIDKSYFNDGKAVTCQIDFDSGDTVKVIVALADPIALDAIGHGLSQKLGDAASGAESTSDAYEAILEIAARLSKGEWLKSRGTGEGGTAKGASELLEALCVVLGKDKDFVRALLAELKQSDKLALRKTPEVAAAIEKIKASRAPSKMDEAKVAAGANLLSALKGGTVPQAVGAVASVSSGADKAKNKTILKVVKV